MNNGCSDWNIKKNIYGGRENKLCMSNKVIRDATNQETFLNLEVTHP
jgi:hypothetical protein